MAALLDGLRFEGPITPWPATSIETPACADQNVPDARLLPDSESGTVESAIVYGTLDPLGTRPGIKSGKDAFASRVGDHWCRLVVDVGTARVPVLRTTAPGGGAEGNSALFVLYSDAGGALEVVRVKSDHYLLINQAIGSTDILGTYASMPSLRQLAEILAGKGDGGRPRARIVFKANGNSTINIQVKDAPHAAPST